MYQTNHCKHEFHMHKIHIFTRILWVFFTRFQAFSDPLSLESFLCVSYLCFWFGKKTRAHCGNGHFALLFPTFSIWRRALQEKSIEWAEHLLLFSPWYGNNARRFVVFAQVKEGCENESRVNKWNELWKVHGFWFRMHSMRS